MGEKKINDKASGGVYSMRDLVREKLVNYWNYVEQTTFEIIKIDNKINNDNVTTLEDIVKLAKN